MAFLYLKNCYGEDVQLGFEETSQLFPIYFALLLDLMLPQVFFIM
jgi:hypothetical protein